MEVGTEHEIDVRLGERLEIQRNLVPESEAVVDG